MFCAKKTNTSGIFQIVKTLKLNRLAGYLKDKYSVCSCAISIGLIRLHKTYLFFVKTPLLYRMVCVGLLLLAYQNTRLQSVSFQYLSKKDGLSQSSVFAIVQDSAGFMWFGTRDGLNQYDGYNFKVYRSEKNSNSLISNDIRTLYVDPLDKSLWIGTVSGLSNYQTHNDHFSNYQHLADEPQSLSYDFIRQIFRDSKERLWVITSIGLNLYDDEKQVFTPYYINTQSRNSSENNIECITEDNSGALLFGTANGIYQLVELVDKPNISYDFKPFDWPSHIQLSDQHIKRILPDTAGNLWIGTETGGVNYWDQENQDLKTYQNGAAAPYDLSNNLTRAMSFDQEGNLWVGTFDGLNLLKKGTQRFTSFQKAKIENTGLSDNSVRCLYFDRRGSLWIGTYYGGVSRFDENYNRFSSYKYQPFSNSISAGVVSSFAEDSLKNLWIGTEGGGLNYFDRASGKFSSFHFDTADPYSLSGENVKQLLLDDIFLWVGTFQAGLNRLDLTTKKFTRYQHHPNKATSLSHNNVYDISRIEDKLWVLTYGGGLNLLDLKTEQFLHYRHIPKNSNSLSSDLARVLLQTSDGQIWVGTEKGVNRVFRDQDGLPAYFETFLKDEKIYTLQEDSHKNIWIGTISNGIYCIDLEGNQKEHFTIADGLPGNTVFGILEAASEELWLSTNNGLSKFDLSSNTFTNYNYSNGLKNLEYNFNAYYKTSRGEMFFGGINGFTFFNPQEIEQNEFIPSLVFTQLRRNNQEVLIGKKPGELEQNINNVESITFAYNEANFTLCFAALDYFSPKNNHYAYKLEGLDKDWTHRVGETEATYTIQREGEYVFRLKGANSDGVWNPQERQLLITVLPPPWRTWWAYLLYLCLTAAGVYGLLYFIQLRHKLQLEQIAKQQQEELMEMKLRFFTNITHEFRTPLTLILGPLQHLLAKVDHSAPVLKQLSLIERNAQRLLNLVNQVLSFRKLATDHERLKITPSNIVHFLHELFLPFQETANLKNIHYNFQSANKKIVAWFDQDKLEKVIFNLLSNAFKFTPSGGSISMTIEEKEQCIEVKITDSGIGIKPELYGQIFKRFYEKSDDQHSTIKSSGIGLAISKQMVEMHHGKIFVQKNLTLNGSQAKGATFVVQIPKGKSHFKETEIIAETDANQSIQIHQPFIIPTIHHTEILPPAKQQAKKDAPLVLIVEDNEEVRTYIAEIFVGTYRLATAKNGVEGLEKAKKILPDIIISDVMMPEMDGITLCSKLKMDIEISHIPIILLTARTASLFKIEGLKTGADDYITKPFNPEELILRVRNIIQSRQEAKDKFARVLTFDPKEISITSADEQFLTNAMTIIEKQMSNYDFKVVQFASDLAVSRPLLFTKLKALTGQTPNNFIKTIRLKRAAQLLKTQKLNVSEVAYQVGFKDPKYFRKCFRDQFGELPSTFGKS